MPEITARFSSPDFMGEVRAYPVPRDSIAVWTLGQNGFLLKSPQGTVVAIDPYLTDHGATLNAIYGLDFGRILPVFIEPEDLSADLVLLTHSHLDHTDPETIRRFTRKNEAQFVAPWQAWRQLPDFGVEPTRATLIHPLETIEFSDLKVTSTFAVPTDSSDLNHVGFVVEFGNRIRFYNSGDTAFHELLGHVARMEPRIISICINGGFNNLSQWDAARVVELIKPEIAIPAHFDMMACNQQDPAAFEHALKAQNVSAKYARLHYYEPFLYSH